MHTLHICDMKDQTILILFIKTEKNVNLQPQVVFHFQMLSAAASERKFIIATSTMFQKWVLKVCGSQQTGDIRVVLCANR